RRLKAQAEALRHAEQETQLLAELESIRERVELNEQSWPEKELTIKAQIAALRKAETIQLKRLEKIEARLHGQEAASKQVKTKTSRGTKSRKANAKVTANTKADQLTEKHRIALLEAILSATELDLEQHSTKEQQLHTRIQALFGQEIEQVQRIEEAKARLRAHEAVLQMRVDDKPRLLAETVPPATEAVDIHATTETQTLPLTVEIHGANFENGAENQFQVESGEPKLSATTEATSTEVFAPQSSMSDLQENEWPVDAIADDSTEPEAPEFEIELSEFDFQSELANFEGNSSSFVGQPDEQVEANSVEEIDLVSDDWVASPFAESSEMLASIEANDLEKSIDPVEAEKSIQPSSEAIPTSELVEGLTSGDAAKRAASLHELAELDDDYAFGLITDLFDNSSAEVRNEAARALHEFKPDHAASFTRALREGSTERRRNIAAALNGSGLAAEAIQNLLGESREKTYDAFSLLFLMAKAGEIRPLLLTIEKHPDVAVRLSVIRLLTFSNQPDIIPAFRSLAVRASLPTEVRSAVMEAIYEISSNARENSRSVA
ncbi:MAG TPA: HEAT repeat domain-containing protein, partial [Pyrinomonadaceae bacterium]